MMGLEGGQNGEPSCCLGGSSDDGLVVVLVSLYEEEVMMMTASTGQSDIEKGVTSIGGYRRRHG